MSTELKIEKVGENGKITGPRSPRFLDTARELPGRRRWKEGALFFELSAANIETVRKRHPKASWDEELKPYLKKIDEVRQFEQDALNNTVPKEVTYEFKTEPFDHQRKAFNISADREYYAFFMDMGTGKSKVIVDTAAYLFQKNEIGAVLLFSPKGVHEQWVEEQFALHCPLDYAYWIYYPHWEKTSHMVKDFEKVCESKNLKIFTFNHDVLSNNKGLDLIKDLLEEYKCMVGIDESTAFGNMSAKRTKNLMEIREKCAYRRLLTGTPITKGVENLYSQLCFLNENILGFTSFYSFRHHFCELKEIKIKDDNDRTKHKFKKTIGHKNLEELQTRIDGHAMRLRKEDCFDLPEKTEVVRNVELTEDQRRHYEEMRDLLITQLDSGEIVSAQQAVTKALRLQQILCGFLIDEDKNVIWIPSNRHMVTIDTIEEISSPTIVWAHYKPDAQLLTQEMKKRGISFGLFGGATPDAQRKKSIADFKSGKTDVLLASYAMSKGWNLTESCYAIYHSLSYSYEDFYQSKDRIYRSGQTKPVTYTFIRSKGTHDENVVRNLKEKHEIAETVLDIREWLS